MGIILAFITGTVCSIFFLSLMQAGARADEQADLYWEGYERGYSDASQKMKPLDE